MIFSDNVVPAIFKIRLEKEVVWDLVCLAFKELTAAVLHHFPALLPSIVLAQVNTILPWILIAI